MHRVDPNDLAHALRLGLDPVAWAPSPRSEDGAINPQVTRFALADGRWADVVHVKPIYYETPEGAWRPLSEVCSHHGNRHIAIRPDRVSWMHPRFLLWLMKRQRLLGSELAFWAPGYVGVQPRHLAWMDTLTAYPDPNPETTTVDGRVARISDPDWATAHDTAAGTIAGDADADCYIYAQTTGVVIIQRGFFLFNTAALGGSGATISSATASWVAYNSGFSNTDNDGDDWLNVVQSNPASNTAIVTADYNKCGSAVSNPSEGSTRIDYGSLTHNDATYNDFTLNGTGTGWVAKSGVTKLGLREGHDCINSAVSGANVCGIYCADVTGTSKDPKLVIDYTPPPPAGGLTDPLRAFQHMIMR